MNVSQVTHHIEMRGLQLLLVGGEKEHSLIIARLCVDTKSSDYCWHYRATSQDTNRWLAQQGDRKGTCRHTSNTVISTLEANLMLHCQPTFSFFYLLNLFIFLENLTILSWRLSVLNTQNTCTFCSTELKFIQGVYGWLALWMIAWSTSLFTQ